MSAEDSLLIKLSLTHQHVLGVGEDVHRKHLEWAASERRRSALATEESVRHEEKALREKEIGELEERFERKKGALLRRCTEEKEEAVTAAVREVTTRLQAAEERRVERIRQEDAEQARRAEAVLKARCDAEKEAAVLAAREEERSLAHAEAERVAELVEREQRVAAQRAEEGKRAALEQLEEALRGEHSLALERRAREVREAAALEHGRECACYEDKLSELRGSIWLRDREAEGLRARMAERDAAQKELQCRYDDLRREFADFVNQVPGFRDEFVLK